MRMDGREPRSCSGSRVFLIAVDFERGAPSGIRYTAGTVAQLGNVTAYWLPPAEGGGSEAWKDDRSPGYRQNDDTIFLIEKIEVYQSFGPRIRAWLAKSGRRQSRGSAPIREAVL
jgi:hypothetical protein